MGTVDRVAFAIPLKAERVEDVFALARAATIDPSVVDMSRRLGLQRSLAWIQEEDPPILTAYMEWKVDPVQGLQGYETSPEMMAGQIRMGLRQAASSPGDAALDEAVSRSEIVLDWQASDRARGADIRCYARLVPQDRAEAKTRFMQDLDDPVTREIYSRQRERVGFKRITVWREPSTSGDVLFIELYESDDLDRSFKQLARSKDEFDELFETRTALIFGWTPATMPPLRSIYEWGSSDGD